METEFFFAYAHTSPEKKENKKNNNTPQFILNMIWSREMKKK